MNKLNKKGFTLIEMLVVIAIIAVLVAIVIPTVSNATTKSAAAADAANLRSFIAEASTDYLAGANETTVVGLVQTQCATDGDGATFTISDNAPTAKTRSCKDATAVLKLDPKTNIITATFGGHDVNFFAAIAETGKAPTGGSTTTPEVQPGGGAK